MTKSLTLSDVLGLGFMTFAFYLGAGNIIFPPLAGYMAGEHLSLAMLGFLVTAVGLPLITILAVAKAGNGWAGMTKLLPTGVATALAAERMDAGSLAALAGIVARMKAGTEAADALNVQRAIECQIAQHIDIVAPNARRPVRSGKIEVE